MTETVRVIIADDHPLLRRGIRGVLAGEPDIQIVGEAGDASELASLLKEQPCEVLLLDITMPGRSGLDILDDLARTRPRLRVLVLSMHPEDQFAVRAFKAGAAGYMTKESAAEELARAIRRLHHGGRYVSPSLAEFLAGRIGGDAASLPHEALSNRQFEVLRHLASGRTVKQIAAALGLSVKTVSTHRARLLEKMAMETNAQLVSYAIRQGLSDDPPARDRTDTDFTIGKPPTPDSD